MVLPKYSLRQLNAPIYYNNYAIDQKFTNFYYISTGSVSFVEVHAQ
jgi:hypothetical protein